MTKMPPHLSLGILTVLLSVFCGACSNTQQENVQLSNGSRLALRRASDGAVKHIAYFSPSDEVVLHIEILCEGHDTKLVRFMGADGSRLGLTTFAPDASSTSSSGLITYESKWESSPQGGSESRLWTLEGHSVVYGEQIEFDSKGRVVAKALIGPQGVTLGRIDIRD